MNETLQQLHEKVTRKQHLEVTLADLRERRRELLPRVDELYGQRAKEQRDVDRLEGRSLANFFYRVVGKMDEKLNQEQVEAYAAAVRYDAAKRELEDVEDAIARREAELRELEGCEARYALALSKRTEELKAAGGAKAGEITALEGQLMDIESQRRELREAIFAGNNALMAADRVRAELAEADSWSTFDILGGGIIAGAIKHEHMDNAQNEVENLQLLLRRFKTELADVTIQADIQIRMDDFTRFADHFFDGLFVDWTVAEQIKTAQGELERTYERIGQVQDRLGAMEESLERRRVQVQGELDALVVRA
ncbi:MAG: hypothetical protein IJZ66_00805 [Oscillibacter sp.]|nr:hypothetical protein [Oscillibacter sp.]